MIDQLPHDHVRLVFKDEYIDVVAAEHPTVDVLAAKAKYQWPDIPDYYIMRLQFNKGWSVVWHFDGTDGDGIISGTVLGHSYWIRESVPEK